jgi:hypothetical protein
MKRVFSIFVAAVVLTGIAGSAMAFDASQIRVNGFVSQGYITSSNNQFMVKDSTEGSFQLNEAGLTINAPVDDKLRVGLQLLSRDFGSEGNNQIKLDWGYGDYRVSDMLGFRAGKIKAPMGLYNQGRDSDFLRYTALLPQGLYAEQRRDYTVANTGFGVYGNIQLGGAGDIDYQAVVGEINVSEDNTLLKSNLWDTNAFLLAFGPPGGPLATELVYESGETTNAALVYNLPVDGLRMGLSYMENSGVIDVKSFGLSMGEMTNKTGDFVIWSAEYANDLFVLASEFWTLSTVTDMTAIFGPGPFSVSENDSEGYYLQATLVVPGADGLYLTGLYDVYHPNKESTSGPTEYRNDSALAIRYDVTESFSLKAEFHDVEGAAGVSRFLNNPDPMTDLREENWNYSVVKASYVF